MVSDIEHLVAIWISDKYGSSLVYREIGSNFLPRLLNNENDHSKILAVKVIELLTEISWHPLRSADSNKIEANFKDNEYIASEIFQSHSRLVGEKLELQAVKVFESRITEAMNKTGRDDYSSIWRPD